eukprot:4091318-Prymnesium_polylepis.1
MLSRPPGTRLFSDGTAAARETGVGEGVGTREITATPSSRARLELESRHSLLLKLMASFTARTHALVRSCPC